MAVCKSCGAEIVWQMTGNGKMTPLDPPLLTITTERGEVVRGRQSHFSTCPDADKHRKPKGGADEDNSG